MSVDLLLAGLKGLLPFQSQTSIDTPICKLHYTFTTNILLTFCVLITATNLIGQPMLCTFNEHPILKDDMINSYCWIQSTYTTTTQLHTGPSALHPGVGTPQGKNDEKIYHSYYQWVPFLLFLQALMFYAPHWLWLSWEGGKVSSVSQELQSFLMKKEDRQDRIQLLAEYLHDTLHRHNFYAMKYLFCEILNFINTVLNIWILNIFLNGKFVSYGTEFLSFSHNDIEDKLHPKLTLFPRMTKCDFYTSGPSGTPQNHDIMCLLPHSIVNEKVYLILWLWLWMLLASTIVALFYRFTVFFVPAIRSRLLLNYVGDLNKNDIKTLSVKLEVGDYFLLYLLQKNVSNMAFRDLVQELSGRIDGKATNNVEMGEKVTAAGRGYSNYLMNEPR